MDRKSINSPIHEHPLFASARILQGQCSGCHVDEAIYETYFCNEYSCFVGFHKQCAEAPLEINHPWHPEHPLLITNDVRDGPCDFCGQKLLSPSYSCPTCRYNVDLTCGMKPSPPVVEHPSCHEHPIVFLKKQEEETPCDLCTDSIGGPSYSCLECKVYFHLECICLSKEVNHPCHPNHPLKLIASNTLTNDATKYCFFCGEKPRNMLYHCSTCNFTTCLQCTRNPPPPVIEHTKTHKHPLVLLSSKITSTCKVCGRLKCTTKPYICLQCDFAVGACCIDSPRVIAINRHDHRISFTNHLGVGYLKCGVCRRSISQYYGAYSCSVCPNYAVHPRCGLGDVWDGRDLEGIAEDSEDIDPFKVVGDNLICHFNHENHTLRLRKDGIIHDDSARCEACRHPIGFDPIYSCEECPFILHEKCANLRVKKRLVFSNLPYKLVGTDNGAINILYCTMCRVLSTGFIYTSERARDVDAHCGSLSEPYVHDGHLHPLYFYVKKDYNCHACKLHLDGNVLSCDVCEFDLCLYCASLPKKIWHKNDEHPLTLCCGEKASGKFWCDICEAELDPSKWFYTCYDCGVTMHAQCVLGDFARFMPGDFHCFQRKKFEGVLNNHNTRPLCSQCRARCKFSIILKICYDDNGYVCSLPCFMGIFGYKKL